jgi:hypothetical protein
MIYFIQQVKIGVFTRRSGFQIRSKCLNVNGTPIGLIISRSFFDNGLTPPRGGRVSHKIT